MELINCTPHDVVIFTPYGGKKTIKASGDVARLHAHRAATIAKENTK